VWAWAKRAAAIFPKERSSRTFASKPTVEEESSLVPAGTPGPLVAPERKFLELGLLSTIMGSGEEYTGTLERKAMKTKLLAATVVVVAAFTTPALADFWIVQDSSTKHCSIVEQRPTTTTTTIVGDREFKTRAEADSQMKRVEVCRESTTGGPARAPAR
jgi:hypothetical protein